MEKFKEKKSIDFCENIMAILFIIFIVSVFISIFYNKAILGILSLLLSFPFALYSKICSKKEEYTQKFIEYIENKIKNAKTLEEFNKLYQEFEYLSTENNRFFLSFPNDLKSIQSRIIDCINLLEKIK